MKNSIQQSQDPATGTVTHWIHRLQSGDQQAVEPLWNEYFPRLVALARKSLRPNPSRVFDEEDAALSAFATFWRRVSTNGFDAISDRSSLWRLLATITMRKISRYRALDSAEKRGGKAERRELHDESLSFAEIFTADLDIQAAEMLELLQDETLIQIATLRLMNYNVEEVAVELGLSLRTIERKLKVIRTLWAETLET